jgi:hypothetical protein
MAPYTINSGSINNKDGWNYINELLNRKSQTTIINEIKADEKTITGNQNIANEFNKFLTMTRCNI